MKRISFFATLAILLASATLVVAGGRMGQSGMGCKMGMENPGINHPDMNHDMDMNSDMDMDPAMEGQMRHSGMEGQMRHSGMEGQMRHSGMEGQMGHSGMEGQMRHSGMEGQMRHSGMEGQMRHSGMEGQMRHSGMRGQMKHSGMGGKMGHPGKGHGMRKFSELDLTTEQQEAIQSLSEAFHEETTSLRTQMSEKKGEMEELWSQTPTDADAIREIHAEIHELAGEMQTKATDHRLSVREVLTPEQISQLIEPPSLFVHSGLDLSTEQTEAIRALQETLEDDMEPLKAELSDKKAEMKDLWNQATLDEETIHATQTEIHDLMGEMQEKRMAFRLAVHEILTPEQLEELTFGQRRGYPSGRMGLSDRGGRR